MLAILRLGLLTAAGYGLWRLWIRNASVDSRVTAIVGAGFVLRVVLAQALFWISWFGLPIGRSLQLGGGFWFFAPDGQMYLQDAQLVAQQGPLAVMFLTFPFPSHFFVQVIAVCTAMFGSVASLAMLVNGAAYLATCAMIARLAGPHRPAPRAVLIALSAVAFGPGTVLWSLQLLKDTLLMAVAVAILATCRDWERYWLESGPARSSWRATAVAAGMAIGFYALSGMRWYFALVIWLASLFFFSIVAWRARPRRVVWVASAVLFVLLGQCVRWGGERDIPPSVGRFLDPHAVLAGAVKPSAVSTSLAATRRGFEHTPAATTIRVGPTLATAGETPSRLTAVLLPRALGQPLGLVRVDGGRGLWLFAEIDTIAFGLVVLFAIVYSFRRLISSRSPVPALFVVPALTFLILLPLMVYAVNNFGTLLRLRQMLYLAALIVPVTLLGTVPYKRETAPTVVKSQN